MNRSSFRSSLIDIHKKLPIDETSTSARKSQRKVPFVKEALDIPTPLFVEVDSYENDCSRTFKQPKSYIQARREMGVFVEYDLDSEDEDWLQEVNKGKKVLESEKFETILYRLEVLDHQAREKAGPITPPLCKRIPILLTFDTAVVVLRTRSIKYAVFQSIYNYWKEKRERWRKPVLRHLQVVRVRDRQRKCFEISASQKSNSSGRPMEEDEPEKTSSTSSCLTSDFTAVCSREVKRMVLQDRENVVSLPIRRDINGATTRSSPAHIRHRAEAILRELSSCSCASEVKIRQLLGDNPSTSKALRM